MRCVAFRCVDITIDRFFLAIADQKLGVMFVGMNLMIVAIKQIKTLLLWYARGANVTDAPFPKAASSVASGFQYLGYRDIVLRGSVQLNK